MHSQKVTEKDSPNSFGTKKVTKHHQKPPPNNHTHKEHQRIHWTSRHRLGSSAQNLRANTIIDQPSRIAEAPIFFFNKTQAIFSNSSPDIVAKIFSAVDCSAFSCISSYISVPHCLTFTTLRSRVPRFLEKVASCKRDPLQSLKKSTKCWATGIWKVPRECLDTAFRFMPYDLGCNSPRGASTGHHRAGCGAELCARPVWAVVIQGSQGGRPYLRVGIKVWNKTRKMATKGSSRLQATRCNTHKTPPGIARFSSGSLVITWVATVAPIQGRCEFLSTTQLPGACYEAKEKSVVAHLVLACPPKSFLALGNRKALQRWTY